MTDFLTTADGTRIFYKDWGPRTAPPIFFHHGWPLTSDEWDVQMMYFLDAGFRVVAHDRRGHGRSSQTEHGTDMDTYAADVTALVEHLDLKEAVHIGHSTGGGEATRYVANAKPGRVAKAVLVGAIPPVMIRSEKNPGGQPVEAFDGLRKALAANRAQFYLDLAAGPFYGFNREGATRQEATIRNWWRQSMEGAIKPQYDCIKVWSETDFTADLQRIEVPVLLLHGDDDQVVPIDDSARLSIKLLKNGELKVYPGYPHGMLGVHADVLNPDILAFIRK